MNAPLRAALLVLLALVTACTATQPERAAPGLAGTWTGDGRVIVTWAARERLPVTLTITEGGAVTGRVGDAQLIDAHVHTNRSELSRSLGLWTDWIVEGRLEGELLADEGFLAQRVSIPFDFYAGRIEGGLHAKGAFLDGRNGGRLSVADLRLQQVGGR